MRFVGFISPYFFMYEYLRDINPFHFEEVGICSMKMPGEVVQPSKWQFNQDKDETPNDGHVHGKRK